MSDVEIINRTQRIAVGSASNYGVEVLSRTQRIVVNSPKSVTIVYSGPVGPTGPAGGNAASASGIQEVPLEIHILEHNLGFYPAGVKFTSLDDENELEPEDIIYSNPNVILAIWPEPTAAKWMIS